jgi:phosphatidate cytidylyltransferase
MIDWIAGVSPTGKGILLVLAFLALISFLVWILAMSKRDSNELVARTRSWWVMAAIFMIAVVSGNRHFSVMFFCFLSLWATKEYLSVVDIPIWHRPVLIWSYVIIVMQYYWIAIDWYGMFLVFIPIFGFRFISTRVMLTNEPDYFLGSSAKILWGLLAFGLGLSHLGYLINIPGYHGLRIDGRSLLLFLVVTTEFNDVAQYFWGKLFGKHKILPVISPKKTWEGFIGGVVTAIAVCFLFKFLTPFKAVYEIVFVSLAISISGFFGDVVMSAVKRDMSVKDFGTAIPGHGGILDRLDSISFTAPIFFHIIRYWYWPSC